MSEQSVDQTTPWRQYICLACGLIYDEEQGDPDSGLAPGTRFEDIPDDWECPLCGVTKTDFELLKRQEITVCDQPMHFNRKPGVVVIGAGIAGWSTVEALRALDATVPITLVTACSGDTYHKPELSVAISRGADKTTLVRETGYQAAQRLGVQLMAQTFAVGLSPTLKQLRTTRGSLNYTQLVLAQGAQPILPAQLPAPLCWRVNDLAGWSGLQQALAQGKQSIAYISEELRNALFLERKRKNPSRALLGKLCHDRQEDSKPGSFFSTCLARKSDIFGLPRVIPRRL